MRRATMYKPISIPERVAGMTQLDRSKFSCRHVVPSLALDKSDSLNDELSKFKPMLLKMPGRKPVQEVDSVRRLLLDPSLDHSKLMETYHIQPLEIELTYENFTAQEAVQKVLSGSGSDVGGAGFSIVGHIVHLNLRAHLDPFKKVIGQILLDKMKRVELVVNKTSQIESEYRNFNFEVLAGTAGTVVRVREHGCLFELDFATVYWNPRLATEHNRVTLLLKPESVLFDVFAGVGPFAIPAARKGCTVYANDLNPSSFEYLVKNIKLNKVSHKVEAFNLDGRDFLKTVVREKVKEKYSKADVHVTANLPAIAVDFMDVFKDMDLPKGTMLHIHCYLFLKSTAKKGFSAAWDMVLQKLGDFKGIFKITSHEEHFVRQVSPSKEMVRASFVILYTDEDGPEDVEPAVKKSKPDTAAAD
ncbi:tRNA (guanine(37)-N1)-methyltransferase [Galendromus occidentalis]|uniref:tRNA (guanine(37)-N1)-methyltransferase n=1 Tax=Galendromus occidentalis TaxID=34638 RepID=A0AAJ6QLY7_9ACAR|nr:tRNA (guanine(37)-N1)-methyltransferase [Galendromus occidentalis]